VDACAGTAHPAKVSVASAAPWINMLRIIGVLLLIRGSIQPANSMMKQSVNATKLSVPIAAIAQAYLHAGVGSAGNAFAQTYLELALTQNSMVL